MYLVEGGRAAWVLEPVRHTSQEAEPIIWVPCRPERILADGLVMIAAIVEEDAAIRELIEKRLEPSQARALLSGDWADLTKLPKDLLEEIESAALRSVRSKLVVTAMSGTSLTGQIALLDQCSMDAEVCTVSWIRETDSEGNSKVAGDLPPDDPDGHRFYELRV